MFEQSILVDHATGKRWSVLVSLTSQLLLIGTAALIPILFTDQLSPIRLARTYVAPQVPPPPPSQTSAERVRPAKLTARTSAFTAPVRIPKRVDLTSDLPAAPEVNAVPGVIGSTGVLNAIGVAIGQVIRSLPPPPARPAAKPVEQAPSKPIPISSSVQSAKLLKKVIPRYPPLARQARISGTVRLVGVIGKDGTIQNLQLVSGSPLLVQAAMDAVRQWIYSPTLLNDKPVEVIAPIDVIFTLTQ